jgi:hypothetical protein
MFNATLESFQSIGIAHNSKANDFLRKQYGASYNLNEIVNFKKGENQRLSDVRFDLTSGKPLINEKTAAIYLDKNTRKFTMTSYIAIGSIIGAPPYEGTLQIHTHDNLGKSFLVKSTVVNISDYTQTFQDKPSKDDWTTAAKVKSPYYNVVVSDNSIQFYRYDEQTGKKFIRFNRPNH